MRSLYSQDTALAQIPMAPLGRRLYSLGRTWPTGQFWLAASTWGALHGPLGTMPSAITDVGLRMLDSHPASAIDLDGALVMPLPLCRPHFPPSQREHRDVAITAIHAAQPTHYVGSDSQEAVP